jgi:hypothetical protein
MIRRKVFLLGEGSSMIHLEVFLLGKGSSMIYLKVFLLGDKGIIYLNNLPGT